VVTAVVAIAAMLTFALLNVWLYRHRVPAERFAATAFADICPERDRSRDASDYRELAARSCAGMAVSLLWHPETDDLLLRVWAEWEGASSRSPSGLARRSTLTGTRLRTWPRLPFL
jgi:hypothetical protein